MATDVQVPALGESITEGTLAQWLKKPGEAVAADEPIASLETDKVSVEVPSPVAGVLTEQLVQEGDTVAVGAPIARIDEGATARFRAVARGRGALRRPTLPARAKLRRCAATITRLSRRGTTRPRRQTTTSRPCLPRCAARCSNIMSIPTRIQGTGKDGRLTKDDVIAAAEAQKTSSPAQAGAQAPQAKAPAPRSEGSASWAPAFAGERASARKSASRCRACARPSPGASRKRRTPRPC